MTRLPARFCIRAALALAAALGLGLSAELAVAARVVDVRVGRHPDFVRIVFETDAPVGFALGDELGPEGEVRVRLDASSSARRLSVPGDPDAEVRVEPLPDGGTLARIRSSVPVRIESQVLERPPRVVLDLRPGPADTEPEPAIRVPVEPPPGAASGPAGEPSVQAEPPAVAEPPAAEPGSVELAVPSEPPVTEPPVTEPPVTEPPVTEPPVTEAPPAEPAPQIVPVAEPAPEPAVEPAPPIVAGEPEPEPKPEPKPEAEQALPPVSGPAPDRSRGATLDDRALGLLFVGGLGGLVIGVLASAPWRRRRPPESTGAIAVETAAAAETPAEVATAAAPPEAPADLGVVSGVERPAVPGAGDTGRFRDLVDGLRTAGSEPSREAAIRESDLASDLLAMIQALDRRFAAIESETRTLHDDTARLGIRQGAQGEELAAQRGALARLERVVRRGPSARASAPPAPGQRPPSF
jgi:hypothetical protein